MQCPQCENKKICNIPSSTLPIDDRTNKYLGSNLKVDKNILKVHKSIKHICTDCCYEW